MKLFHMYSHMAAVLKSLLCLIINEHVVYEVFLSPAKFSQPPSTYISLSVINLG